MKYTIILLYKNFEFTRMFYVIKSITLKLMLLFKHGRYMLYHLATNKITSIKPLRTYNQA